MEIDARHDLGEDGGVGLFVRRGFGPASEGETSCGGAYIEANFGFTSFGADCRAVDIVTGDVERVARAVFEFGGTGRAHEGEGEKDRKGEEGDEEEGNSQIPNSPILKFGCD